MSVAMDSFRAIINRWDSAELLAIDLGEKGGTVRQWRARNSIPPTHWLPLIAAAKRRGYSGINLNLLATLAAERAAA